MRTRFKVKLKPQQTNMLVSLDCRIAPLMQKEIGYSSTFEELLEQSKKASCVIQCTVLITSVKPVSIILDQTGY